MDVEVTTEPEIRFLAEKWLRELGADAPSIIRSWCEQVGGATAAGLLEKIAGAAADILEERRRSPT